MQYGYYYYQYCVCGCIMVTIIVQSATYNEHIKLFTKRTLYFRVPSKH